MFKTNQMILVTLFLIASCSFRENWPTYFDNINHFSISYPESWTKEKANGSIAFLSAKESSNDMFCENVNLMLQDLSQQPLTLEQYTNVTKKQVVDNLGVSAILSIKDITLSGQQAKEFIYNMDYQGRKLKMKQYWFVKDNLAYLFTYTAEPSQFDRYESIATKIVTSFKFSK